MMGSKWKIANRGLFVWVHSHKKDIGIIAVLALFLTITAYIVLGFAAYGLYTPYVYAEGDEIPFFVKIKQINDTGWSWDYSRFGAPFDYKFNFSFSLFLLYNFDQLILLVISFFTDNIAVIFNLFRVCIFPICGMTSYVVCRVLRLRYVPSVLCSVFFAFSPYIFHRIGAHVFLASSFFVPFSVLLCIWSFDASDNTFLKFGKGFFKRGKNIAALIMCMLIGNNGEGYYSIFTCFFLLIVVIINAIKEKKISSILPAIKNICFIAFSFFMAILPFLYSTLVWGIKSYTARLPLEAELYGLKISQFFVPFNSHGIGILQEYINQYNNNMLLVNENASSYLGIAGIIGFLGSLLILMYQKKTEDVHEEQLYLLSRLNIGAILLCTIGGFSSLIGLFFTMVRGYNRISIFVSFISILTFGICIQKLFDRIKGRYRLKRSLVYMCVAFVAVLTIADSLPTYDMRGDEMKYYSDQYYADAAFFSEVEASLGEDASLFQLPYQGFEDGPINSMGGYGQFRGFIHTDTLRWSCGAAKRGKEDMWWNNVSHLPVEEMVEMICKAGFSAIYINSKAYLSEDLNLLKGKIEDVIGELPMTNGDGTLLVYDLRPYKEKNEKVNDISVMEFHAVVYPVSSMGCSGLIEKNGFEITLYSSGIQYGPYVNMENGSYTITVYGENLQNADYDVCTEFGTRKFPTDEIVKTYGKIVYNLTLDCSEEGVEFRTLNNSDNEIKVFAIVVEKQEN